VHRPARVLDVGNCTPDHAAIRTMLRDRFDVRVERVMFVAEALERMRAERFDLVLVNRVIFDDGSDGLALHRAARENAALAAMPIMLVSDYPQAQAASVAAGGVPGFGKSTLDDPETIERLARFLPRSADVTPSRATCTPRPPA